MHAAEEICSLTRTAAAFNGSVQLPPAPTQACYCRRVASLATGQRGRFSLQASPHPLPVTVHGDAATVSAPSAAASGAHTQVPAVVPCARPPEEQDDAPHTPVLLREVTTNAPQCATVTTRRQHMHA